VLSEEGIDRCQELAGVGSFYDAHNIEWPHHIDQALKANNLYKKDKEYVVDDGPQGPEIVIVDSFTGRKMAGRRWSDGLHQAVEAKEGLRLKEENQTLATITYQNFFRLYDKLSGMTGTAMTEAAEFLKIYQLDCVVMPTNRRLRRDSGDDLIYRTEREKYAAVADEIEHQHNDGRPVLVGTTSVEKSERLARILDERDLSYELLNAKQHEREAHIVANAGQSGSITIATNMAGRGTDIILGEGVKGMGGLHVVGTERHEARRIDNQLRGRAGRQGDPGSSQFFLSLEDDLMRIFAKDWVGTMLGKLGMEDGQEIQSPMVSRMIERVQKKMEAHNFDIRKNLLEYDAVNNEQRSEVYKWRQSILEGKDQADRVQWALEGVCGALADHFLVTEDKNAEPEFDALAQRFEERFGGPMPPAAEFDGLGLGEQKAKLTDAAKALYQARVEKFGEEHMKSLERYLLLRTIDEKWKDNLQALDYLRTGVGMRGYGQEDPKIVYRREAAGFFYEMLRAIQEQCVDLLYKMEPSTYVEDDDDFLDDDFDDDDLDYGGTQPGAAPDADMFDEDDWGEPDDTDWDTVLAEAQARVADLRAKAEEEERKRQQEAAAMAGVTSSAGGPPVALAETGAKTAEAAAHRQRQKTGEALAHRDQRAPDPFLSGRAPKPNDPCPCGSSKKYKKCHG
jgi:preprotein translocase subunit SecA